jgi:hypothetical protein
MKYKKQMFEIQYKSYLYPVFAHVYMGKILINLFKNHWDRKFEIYMGISEHSADLRLV